MKSRIILIAIFVICNICHIIASVPTTTTFQGVITDSDGNTIEDDNYNFTFRIYSTIEGGEAIWEDDQTLPTSDGVYNAILGSEENPLPFEDYTSSEFYVEVEFNGETIEPRIKLHSVPFSIKSEYSKTSSQLEDKVLLYDENDENGERVVVNDNLHINGYLKVGENSIWLHSHNTFNGIQATNHIYIQDGNVPSVCGLPNSNFNTIFNRGSYLNPNSGKVGIGMIGTNQPTNKLHVIDNANPLRLEGLVTTTSTPLYFLTTNDDGVIKKTLLNTFLDNDWSEESSPANFIRAKSGGIASNTAILLGTNANTHINLGFNSTTGNTSAHNESYCVVSGGYGNIANADYAVVGGGESNEAHDYYSTVSGGKGNTAHANYSVVSGGLDNDATMQYSTVIGGRENSSAHYYTVVGGLRNVAAGRGSVIPGGQYLKVGTRSFGFRGGIGDDPDALTDVSPTGGGQNETFYIVDANFWFNFNNLNTDFRIDGLSDYNFFADASTNRIGIGTNSPADKLHINEGGLLVTGNSAGIPVTGSGTRLMYIPYLNGAFRAGLVDGTEWDNIGNASAAFGRSNKVTGYTSFSAGRDNLVEAEYAIALGRDIALTGDRSYGLGLYLESNSNQSFLIGTGVDGTTKLSNNNDNSLLIGFNASADLFVDGDNHYVGIGTITPLNKLHISSQSDPLRLDGLQTDNTLTKVLLVDGNDVVHKADISNLQTNDLDWWRSGNIVATAFASPQYPTDKVGIGTTKPGINTKLTIQNGSLLILGETGDTPLDWLGQELGAGTRLMYIPAKGGAIRAGEVTGSQWNNSNIGEYSVAFGFDNTASGDASISSGSNNSSIGDYSVTFGQSNTVNNDNSSITGGKSNDITGLYSSIAGGFSNSISGNSNFATGRNNDITGEYSFVEGENNSLEGNHTFSVGKNNTIIGDGSLALGEGSVITGSKNFSFGYANTASGNAVNSYLIGQWLVAEEDNSIVIGYGADGANLINDIGNSLMIGFNSSATVFVKDEFVGINDVAPDKNLDITGDMELTGAFYDGFGSAGSTDYVLTSTTTESKWQDINNLISNDLDWELSGSNVFTGHGTNGYPGGNVGIGTTNPTCKLEVDGNVCISGDITVSGIGFFNQDIQVDGDGHFNNNIHLSGALYDGTSSSGLNNNVLISTGSSTQWVDINSLISNDLDWEVDGNDVYTGHGTGGYPSGNIGIGTTSPTNKLHIVDDQADPLRIEDLNSSPSDVLLVVDNTGVVYKRDLATNPISATDADWQITSGGTVAKTAHTTGYPTKVVIGDGTASEIFNVYGISIFDGDINVSGDAVFGQTLQILGAFVDGFGSHGSSNFVLTSTGTKTKWQDISNIISNDLDWEVDGNDVYTGHGTGGYPSGNIGVGTNTPTNKLHILDDQANPLRIEDLNSSTSDILLVVDANGVVYERDLSSSPITDADWQLTSSGTVAQTAHTTGYPTKVVIGDGSSSSIFSVYDGDVFFDYNLTVNSNTYINSDLIVMGNSTLENTVINGDLEANGSAERGNNSEYWDTSSDIRIKQNIEDVDSSFIKILGIRPITYYFKDEYLRNHPNLPNKKYYSFVAQELQQVFPNSVFKSNEFLEDDPNPILKINLQDVNITTIKAVQGLIIQNNEQKNEIKKLNRQLSEMKKEFERIEKMKQKQDKLEQKLNLLINDRINN